MDHERVVRAGVWATIVIGALVLVRIAAFPLTRVRLADAAVAGSARPIAPSRRSADSLAAIVVGRDVFRLTRAPAPVAYDPVRVQQPDQPPPPKPVLVLTGIAWDRTNPSAVLEGLPGVEGPRVVRLGDLIAGLRVARIDRGAVRVTGMDTVWVLTVKEPWK